MRNVTPQTKIKIADWLESLPWWEGEGMDRDEAIDTALGVLEWDASTPKEFLYTARDMGYSRQESRALCKLIFS